MDKNIKSEMKPAFSLNKFYSDFAVNYNREFGNELDGALSTFLRASKTSDSISYTKFRSIYSLLFTRDVADGLLQVLKANLQVNEVSPAMFSFIKQLDGFLYPQNREHDYEDID